MGFGFQDKNLSGYITLLLLLVPSVQIYIASSLDLVIAACMLGALSFHRYPPQRYGILWTIVFLFISSLMSFGTLFLIPVLLGYEYLCEKSLRKGILTILGTIGIYLMIYLLVGFNCSESFVVAARFENPDSLRLIVEPLNYIATRSEGSIKILVFLGPILELLAFKGLAKDYSQKQFKILSLLG
jgi:hypothetical protein